MARTQHAYFRPIEEIRERLVAMGTSPSRAKPGAVPGTKQVVVDVTGMSEEEINSLSSDVVPQSAVDALREAIKNGARAEHGAFLAGMSNSPASVVHGASGYGIAQMIQARAPVPDGTATRQFPPLNLSPRQYNALLAQGYLQPENIAVHFTRSDAPDGLSALARGVIVGEFRAHEAPTISLERTFEQQDIAGVVAPAPVHATFEQHVEVLQALKAVNEALGIQKRIDEEALDEAKRFMLAGMTGPTVAGSALTKALMAAQNGPQRRAEASKMIRQYVDAKVVQAVDKALLHIPKNDVDANVLDAVNRMVEATGRANSGRANWRDDVSPEMLAGMQKRAWDEWANQRAFELASKRVRFQPQPPVDDERAVLLEQERERGEAVLRRMGELEQQASTLLAKNTLPAVTLNNGDTLNMTYKVTVSNDAPPQSFQATIDEIAEGDMGFDIGKALAKAMEAPP